MAEIRKGRHLRLTAEPRHGQWGPWTRLNQGSSDGAHDYGPMVHCRKDCSEPGHGCVRQVVAYIDLRHLHILTSNLSLKGPLDIILLGGQWIGNWCMDWPVKDSQSLPTLHGVVFLLAPPPS